MTRTLFPSTTENLLAKAASLRQQIEELRADGPPPALEHVLRRCQENIDAVDELQRPWHAHHPNLAWRYLHRVDGDLFLVLPREQVLADAYKLRDDFDRNVTDPRTRTTWLGGDGSPPGLLKQAIQSFETKTNEHEARYLLREARHLLDAQTDLHFWSLSVSTLVIVVSSIALAAAMLVYVVLGYGKFVQAFAQQLHEVAVTTPPGAPTLVALALLGLMGGFVSNVVTRKNFLFPAGGPFWRFFLLHVVARPVMSAFGAVLIVVLVKSGLLFAINPTVEIGKGVLALRVPEGALGFTYATLAVASGFGADKVLRAMMGRVLRVLQRKAEKTEVSRPPSSGDRAAAVPSAG